jgi:hypothetical protein
VGRCTRLQWARDSGGRIDGDGEVGFGGAITPEIQLRLDGTDGPYDGWHNWPSYTRVKESGCYAYQVDTADFSYTIVFSAEVVDN